MFTPRSLLCWCIICALILTTHRPLQADYIIINRPGDHVQSGPHQTTIDAIDPPFTVVSSADRPRQLMPTHGAIRPAARAAAATQAWDYDPTSAYDQRGINAVRGFGSAAPNELIDPFSGNLILYHTDLTLPGVAGLDLVLQRVYNSKIHRNYAARVTGDPARVNNGMLFHPTSPLGLGWNMHMGRLIGFNQTGPNNGLVGARYYEKADGSQHPYFNYSGAGCGNETDDVCLVTKGQDNPYRLRNDGPWRMATSNGLNITFDHTAFDGSNIVNYATEIRDAHGNRIQITYHDDQIPGVAFPRDYFRHFIDTIVDSANRTIQFGYREVTPGIVRLTGITAVGHTYRYGYSATNPWPDSQAILTLAQPPAGAPWRYDYAGVTSGDCGNNSKRWCELTQVTYPTGAVIDYTFSDEVFWAGTNAMSVRAVSQRTLGGRAVTAGTWHYAYNRAADYTEDEHTIITKPDGSQEVYTYFGVGNNTYNPLGAAWRMGTLLQKQLRTADGTLLQRERMEWVASEALSSEIFGDPWIGFDVGIFLPRLQKRTIQRGDLTWTTTNATFNQFTNAPRCSVEQGDGVPRYRLVAYHARELVQQGDIFFRFRGLPALDILSYTPFTDDACDDVQANVPIRPATEDEFSSTTYNDLGQPTSTLVNGVATDYRYHGDGTLAAEILYHGRTAAGTPEQGFCTTYDDYRYGVARVLRSGGPAPDCNEPLLVMNRTVNQDGSIATTTDGRDNTTTYTYDGLGRVTQIQPPGEANVIVEYDGSPTAFSTKQRIVQGDFWRELRLDGLGREIRQETAAQVYMVQEYDALGQIRFQSLPTATDSNQPLGHTFTYDALGRTTSITDPENKVISRAYDTATHTVTITDQAQRQTVQTLHAYGDPDEHTLTRIQLPGEPVPATDTYSYLVGGHLQRVNYAGQNFSLTYNYSKQVVRQTNHKLNLSTYWGYDAAGNLICRGPLPALSGSIITRKSARRTMGWAA